MNILAMDLGKNKTVFCEYDSKTAEHKFGKVKTSLKKIHDMLAERREKYYFSSALHRSL